ncbi:MAG: NADH-quinone oxidoreductase subunit N [Gammaproteobacteria bacterium]|nr:MAG: NADH-quinone oxidoreductase subunit NuoN [Pseudomonadota bacterium]MBC6943875.1 NADH-quinone oxidoreductase subunit NuoN [Gammaproteobacteria bacterium]MCE7895321.1 NADH-quinone oxidoreductase subunit NuoN [Gammaproteobacteria bacterium PRO8]MDL1880191.1 NADH-quinone oxidoreductase subunit NuoN [Gammaproteobacteria bacterium PRO2]GJQ54194.1 MAG: NADH-quinone oxidoreductase subunit N [Rhodocyclaceae bacterium]
MNGNVMGFLGACLPEIVVGAGICVVLMAGVFVKDGRHLLYLLAMSCLVAAAWVTGSGDPAATVLMPGGAFIQDPLTRFLKLFVFAVVALVFVYSRAYIGERKLAAAEFYALSLFALLGILVMISSASFLVMYLGLETLSLALYAMVAFERDSPVGAEAAMKYFVLGAIASGCLLYGVSLLYGVTGSILFSDIAAALQPGAAGQAGALVGLAFVLVGIAFKFGAVPFHMWVPDVYQGAPTCVSLFVATAPEVAAFALTLRILVDALTPIDMDWQLVLSVLAILSLGIGNLVAIMQKNIKRMLAYSTIAHVGFILLGFLAVQGGGLQAALYYTIIYVLMAAGAFGVVLFLAADGVDADQLDDFRGLNRRSPWFALMMLIVMFSMIGVPPFAGFYAKWWILSALLESGQAMLATAAVIFSVIGAFYYLRIVHLMYFDEGAGQPSVSAPMDFRVMLSVNALALLGLGLFPAGLLELCARVLG